MIQPAAIEPREFLCSRGSFKRTVAARPCGNTVAIPLAPIHTEPTSGQTGVIPNPGPVPPPSPTLASARILLRSHGTSGKGSSKLLHLWGNIRVVSYRAASPVAASSNSKTAVYQLSNAERHPSPAYGSHF